MGTPNQLYLTWAQIWNVLQNGELDLNDDALMDKTEAMEHANQAVREAEAEIHSIYEDYFVKKSPTNLALVQGQDTIALPTDIYAGKIRKLIYVNGTTVFMIDRIKEWHKFLEYRLLRINPTSTMRYRYFLTNQAAGQLAIVISPQAQESGNYIECWYIRRANEFVDDTSVCDIPEFVQFIYDHIRVKLYEKEGNPRLPKAIADKEATRTLMVETLTAMVPDHDNTIEPDISAYMEHS